MNNLDAFTSFYRETKARIEEKAILRSQELMEEPNAMIRPFMADFADLNTGGKCLRGVLVELGYKIASDHAVRYSDALAVAFELFQTAVLIHDDIIDRAETRRGKETIHTRYKKRLKDRHIRMVSHAENENSLSESAALCMGDLGLFLSNEEVARAYGHDENAGKLILYFDQVILDTIRGELLDTVLPYEIQDPSIPENERPALLEDSVMTIYRLKTARYSVSGPLHLGMLLGEAPEEAMKQMDTFGEDVGIAFQIRDDLLGIYGDEAETGKDVASDAAEFKQTILYQFVASNCPDRMPELLRYYGRPDLSAEEVSALRTFFEDCGAKAYAEKKMKDLLSSAEKHLAEFDFAGEEDKAILRGFIGYLQQ